MTKTIHETQPIVTHGASLETASKAVIMLHGRGATANDIIKTASLLPQGDIAYLAPQAAHNVWYPNSGFGSLEANQPYLSSAIQTISNLIDTIKDSDIGINNIFIGGFSQGACLASEYVAEHPQPYGGVYILSGAIMGAMDRNHGFTGSLADVPVFIGGVDNDSWVKPSQFELTRDVLAGLGADVTLQILEGSDHTIRKSEVEHVSAIINR